MDNQTFTKLISNSPEQTMELGHVIGEQLRGGEIIELSSDLGGGKTTFTKGLATGLGIRDSITSPTFVITKAYMGTALELHHYDFYRLGELGVMNEELGEVIGNTANVTVIEWAGNASKLLPRGRLVRIEMLAAADTNSREIKISFPKNINYISLEGAGI